MIELPWDGWANVDPVIDGPEIVPAQCVSQWSEDHAGAGVVEARSLSKWVGLILSTMTTRNEQIIRLRFGFDGGESMTHDEIAAEVGCGKSAVATALDRMLYWRTAIRHAALSVLSDSPPVNCRNDLARLVERSAIKRIDEPSFRARHRAESEARAAAKGMARVAESMRIPFGLSVYGTEVVVSYRGERLAWADRWGHSIGGSGWRSNPSLLHVAKWKEPTLSNPRSRACVVMPVAPDGISRMRFPRVGIWV